MITHFKNRVGYGIIVLGLSAILGCAGENHLGLEGHSEQAKLSNNRTTSPPASDKIDCVGLWTISLLAPKSHQPGYLKKLDDWYENFFWKHCLREEAEVMPGFEPDLNRKGQFFEGIYLDPNIPDSMYRALAKDLASIRDLTFADPDGKLQAILKTPDLKGETLLKWLQERIKVVLDGPYGEEWRREELPQAEADRLNQQEPLPYYVMGNVSTSFFEILVTQVRPMDRIEKSNYEVPGLKGKFKVLSPHDGVVLLGTQLSSPSINGKPQTESRMRIATLFHEARHADGNQASGSLGFNHHRCGPDSPTRYEKDCDLANNGPFALEGYILRALALTCGDQCDEDKLLSESRLSLERVSRNATEWDDTPELPITDPSSPYYHKPFQGRVLTINYTPDESI